MRFLVISIFLLSFEINAQTDSVSVEKKHRSKFGVSFSYNYSNLRKVSIDKDVPEVVRPNILSNHRGNTGHSINIYNEYYLSNSSRLLVGIYFCYEGYQSKESKYNYYDFPTSPSDTLYPDNTEVSIKYNNRYNYIGISFGYKKYVSNKKNLFVEAGIIPKYLISMSSMEKRTIGASSSTSSLTIENEEYKRKNIDVFLAFGYSLKLNDKYQIEIMPTVRYSLLEEVGFPYKGNLWNIAFKARYAFGS